MAIFFSGVVEGATAVIVDNLISSGGTLTRAAAACRAHGARKVVAVAAHGLFTGGAATLFTADGPDEVIVTDTVPLPQDLAPGAAEKIRIVPVSGLIADVVARMHRGEAVAAVLDYASILNGKPLALVDATGFSWESVSLALANMREADINAGAWQPDRLFRADDSTLERAFGVLFKIPEIRDELAEVTGGQRGDGNMLARIVKDWVGGRSIPEIAKAYFSDAADPTEAITSACRAVHGKLAMTASWGVSALQALTGGDAPDAMSDEELATYRNLPSRIFYGVNSDAAINLRLIGVPRSAAEPMARMLGGGRAARGIGAQRAALAGLGNEGWTRALGEKGPIYRRAWRVLEGHE